MGEFTSVGKVADLTEGQMRAFDVNGTSVAIAKIEDNFYAFGNICTHKRCPLAKGDLDGTTVVCPCHGSRFDVTNGEVLAGPAKEPVGSFQIRVTGDELQVMV